MHHDQRGRSGDPTCRRSPSVFLPRPDPTDTADRLGSVLAARCRPAIPAVHVRPWLHDHLSVEQCTEPARRWSDGSSPTWGIFVGPHVAVWNTFFALIQVAIGAGPALPAYGSPRPGVSFFWAFGVWFFGEGLGLIFTGSASALTGAPGSVFIYGLIGLMAWPRSTGGRGRRTARWEWPLRQRARASGARTTPLAVWSGYWSLAAILFLLPDNRTPTSVSSAITGMSSGEPGAYSHFLNRFGNQFGTAACGPRGCWQSPH